MNEMIRLKTREINTIRKEFKIIGLTSLIKEFNLPFKITSQINKNYFSVDILLVINKIRLTERYKKLLINNTRISSKQKNDFKIFLSTKGTWTEISLKLGEQKCYLNNKLKSNIPNMKYKNLNKLINRINKIKEL
ncbi:MAG: hypothetical protein ACTSXT_13645 [Candidatus Helarchaeota archaeon]